jgi:CO dehydrogenase maturation factor
MHLQEDDVVVMDTHAGVEHFGRALARGFDTAIVVVEPTFNAVQVGVDSARMAAELGIDTLRLAINRSRSGTDVERVLAYIDRLGGFTFSSVTSLPFDDVVLEYEPAVDHLLDGSPLAEAMVGLADGVLASGRRPAGSVA